MKCEGGGGGAGLVRAGTDENRPGRPCGATVTGTYARTPRTQRGLTAVPQAVRGPGRTERRLTNLATAARERQPAGEGLRCSSRERRRGSRAPPVYYTYNSFIAQ